MTTARFMWLVLTLLAAAHQPVGAQTDFSDIGRPGYCPQNMKGCERSWSASVRRCVAVCKPIAFPDKLMVVTVPIGTGPSTGPAAGGTNHKVREKLAEIIEKGTKAQRVELADRLAAPSIAGLLQEGPLPPDARALTPEFKDMLKGIKDGSLAERATIAQKMIGPPK